MFCEIENVSEDSLNLITYCFQRKKIQCSFGTLTTKFSGEICYASNKEEEKSFS